MSKEQMPRHINVDTSILDRLRALGDKEYKHAEDLFTTVLDSSVDKMYLIFLALVTHKVDKLVAIDDLLSSVELRIDRDIDKISTSDLIEFYTKTSDRYSSELTIIRDIVSRLNQRALANPNLPDNPMSSYIPKTLDTQNVPEGTLPMKIYSSFKSEMPKKMTPMSEAYDICTPIRLEIPHLSTAKVNTGLIMQPPPGYHYEVRIRSGLASRGLIMNTGVSLIDEDYCGKDDHLMIILTNVSHKDTFVIEEGSRIAQMTLAKNSPDILFLEQNSPSFARKDSRGGLGSTGLK
jgi:deoxyuridine 5'-triphosphate nucleotidohydrolase